LDEVKRDATAQEDLWRKEETLKAQDKRMQEEIQRLEQDKSYVEQQMKEIGIRREEVERMSAQARNLDRTLTKVNIHNARVFDPMKKKIEDLERQARLYNSRIHELQTAATAETSTTKKKKKKITDKRA
jgi:chaperonin cofactor prefoldin